MANPFYQGVYSPNQNNYYNSNSSAMNFNNIYKMLTSSNNPLQLFESIAMKNPNMAPIVNLLKNGQSPQQVFSAMCEQRGINPQEFINNLTK